MKLETKLKESQKRLKGFWKNTSIHLAITGIIYLVGYEKIAILSLWLLGFMLFWDILEYVNVLLIKRELKARKKQPLKENDAYDSLVHPNALENNSNNVCQEGGTAKKSEELTTTSILSHEKYFITINDTDIESTDFKETVELIIKAIESNEGKLILVAHDGTRPWWQRFFFGLEVYTRIYLMFKWAEDICGLMFSNENESEYRAISDKKPSNITEELREKISFDEEEPLAIKYCLPKETGVDAIKVFLEKGQKPEWLKYDFVE